MELGFLDNVGSVSVSYLKSSRISTLVSTNTFRKKVMENLRNADENLFK